MRMRFNARCAQGNAKTRSNKETILPRSPPTGGATHFAMLESRCCHADHYRHFDSCDQAARHRLALDAIVRPDRLRSQCHWLYDQRSSCHSDAGRATRTLTFLSLQFLPSLPPLHWHSRAIDPGTPPLKRTVTPPIPHALTEQECEFQIEHVYWLAALSRVSRNLT